MSMKYNSRQKSINGSEMMIIMEARAVCLFHQSGGLLQPILHMNRSQDFDSQLFDVRYLSKTDLRLRPGTSTQLRLSQGLLGRCS